MYNDEQVSGLDAHRDIPIGSYLGDVTDELPKTVTFDNFFSGGPKFYCINGRKNETAAEYNVFKVKCLTINRAVEKTFDIEAFKNWFFRRFTSCAPHLAQCVVVLKLVKFKHSFAKND